MANELPRATPPSQYTPLARHPPSCDPPGRVQAGVQSCAVYGAMDQTARKISVGKLRANKAAVMLVTDVAARGIDIPHVTNILHYDFPPTPKLFVHRSGRAGRAGRAGTAFSFVTQEDLPYAVDLHLFLSRPLVAVPMHGSTEAAPGTSWCGAAAPCGCIVQLTRSSGGEKNVSEFKGHAWGACVS